MIFKHLLLLLSLLTIITNSVIGQIKIFSIENKDFFFEDMVESFYENKAFKPKTIQDVPLKDFNSYLLLQLKLFDAKKSNLHKSNHFIREFNKIRYQIVKNHVSDNIISKVEIDKHYKRSKKLLTINQLTISPLNETTEKKIKEIQNYLDSGVPFEQLIFQYALPSLIRRNGRINNYKCFGNVDELENVIFNLKKKEISDPIKTSKAYNIVQLLDIKPNPGKVKVSQILIKARTSKEFEEAKIIIDSIKNLINSGKEFNTIANNFSEDEKSAKYFGEMDWLGKGDYNEKFEDIAFSLKNDELSDVIKTRFGWHIIKRLDYRKDYYTKAEIREILASKYLQDLEKIKTIYNYSENKENIKHINDFSNENMGKILISLDGKNFTMKNFKSFVDEKKYGKNWSNFYRWTNELLTKYHFKTLISSSKDLKEKIDKSFENQLYFIVQSERILNNIIFESNTYFKMNKIDYIKKYGINITFNEIAEEVRNDYTNYLNKLWYAELSTKYDIKIFIDRFKTFVLKEYDYKS